MTCEGPAGRGQGCLPTPTLPVDFYLAPVEEVARALLGCLLISDRSDGCAAGVIVETEAYGGFDDPASHASFRRNGVVRAMWGPPGTAYVYRAYGVYPCFNVVTGPLGEPSAVLIRAIEPVAGLDLIRSRLPTTAADRIGAGPGKLSLALGVTLADNGRPLDRSPLLIAPGAPVDAIVSGPRIGVRRGTDRPWRFGVAGHRALSRPFPRRRS